MDERTQTPADRVKILERRLDRRSILRAAATGAAGMGVAGLLGAQGAQRASAAQAAGCSGGDVNLTYAFWNAEQRPAIESQIEAFRKQYPNISVEPQVVPFADYFTKLQTGIAGGASYDVFWMNGPNFPVYASQGALVDLQPITGSGGVDVNAYPQSLRDLYTYEGKLFGLSRDFDTIGLYYNKDLFDAAEVAYPTGEWTWQDLRSAAEKLTRKEGDTTIQWGYGSTLSDQQNLFNFIPQNGGKFFNDERTQSLLNEPAACDAILFLTDMVQAGLSPSVAEQQANNPYQTLFPAGRIAMMPGGSWHVARLHEANPAIAVAPLPRGTQQATIIHGLANVVWSGSPHQCEALEFVKFLGSQEAEQILADTATVIPSMNGLQETWVQAVPDLDLRIFLDAVNYAVPMPAVPQGAEWQGKLGEVIIGAWSGQIPRDQVCQRAADAVNATLAR